MKEYKDSELRLVRVQSDVTGFGDNGIDLELRLWLEDPEKGVGSVKSDINLEIWKRFQNAGITIPFPQRDVHLIETAGVE